MNSIILAIKYRSETMGGCLQRIRDSLNISPIIPITYAGRLDPMAEGLVIFLVGEMRFLKDRFLHLEKQYRVEFFLGYTTDTFDVLGIPQQKIFDVPFFSKVSKNEQLHKFQPPGIFEQTFPPYSSRKINGTPMFQLAKDNQLEQLPSHNVTLQGIHNISVREISKDVFLKNIQQDCEKVVGDFRQEEIIYSWFRYKNSLPEKIIFYQVTLDTSAGFYVRQWVEDFGNFLSTGAVTFSLIREKIGIFTTDMVDGELRVLYPDNPLIQNLTN